MRTYLGVDAGGSGTALCVLSEQGEVLASSVAASTYYLGQDIEIVDRVLAAAVPAVCAAAGIEPSALSYAFFGLPVYGEASADLAHLDAAPGAVLGHGRYRCDNDMVCGWAGSLALADGVNVISGTGSIAYGQRDGRRVRAGGWGELFGDEGSGYWVGIRGLQAFSQMSDGRRRAGPLLDLLRTHLGVAADLDVVDLVLNRWRGSRPAIAALSRQVAEAADRGDPAAQEILTGAAAALVQLVATTGRRLGFPPGARIAVSYSGGMFAAPAVLAAFRRLCKAESLAADLQEPRFPPVVGAALYAAHLAGSPLGPQALERLGYADVATKP